MHKGKFNPVISDGRYLFLNGQTSLFAYDLRPGKGPVDRGPRRPAEAQAAEARPRARWRESKEPTRRLDDRARALRPGWRLQVPDGVIGGPAERLTNPDLLSSSIFRGWVGDEPFSVIVSTRERAGTTLRRACERIAVGFRDRARARAARSTSRASRSAGASTASSTSRRASASRPTGPSGSTVVVAAATRELVLLTVRRRPEADHRRSRVEDVVGSLRLV